MTREMVFLKVNTSLCFSCVFVFMADYGNLIMISQLSRKGKQLYNSWVYISVHNAWENSLRSVMCLCAAQIILLSLKLCQIYSLEGFIALHGVQINNLRHHPGITPFSFLLSDQPLAHVDSATLYLLILLFTVIGPVFFQVTTTTHELVTSDACLCYLLQGFFPIHLLLNCDADAPNDFSVSSVLSPTRVSLSSLVSKLQAPQINKAYQFFFS